MQKRKECVEYIVPISLLVLLFILASCSPQSSNGLGGIGGNGVLIKWVDNLPPAQIYDDQPFEVALEVENNGASPIGSSTDRIYISGFSRERISGEYTLGEQMPDLEGQTQYNTGGKDLVTFKGTIMKLATANQYNIPLTATACYEYVTEAGGTLCIDPNPYTTSTRQKSCTSGVVSIGPQGAPVKVTSITTEPSPTQTRISITIANNGGGDVYKRDKLSFCSPYNTQRLEYGDQNIVEVEDITVGGESITASCTGLGGGSNARLIGGAAQLRCSYKTTQTTEYTDQITVKLRYGYRLITQKSVVILPTSS